jgi:hypothetical protein
MREGFQDLTRNFLEIGVEHPDDDGQVQQHQHRDDATASIEQTKIPEYQVDWNKGTDRRHHLGGEHPHQKILGSFSGCKGHGPGGRNGNHQGKES